MYMTDNHYMSLGEFGFPCWLINVPAIHKVYLVAGSAERIVCAATPRLKLKISLPVSPTYCTNTRPTSPGSFPMAPASGMVVTGVLISKSQVRLGRDLNHNLLHSRWMP